MIIISCDALSYLADLSVVISLNLVNRWGLCRRDLACFSLSVLCSLTLEAVLVPLLHFLKDMGWETKGWMVFNFIAIIQSDYGAI